MRTQIQKSISLFLNLYCEYGGETKQKPIVVDRGIICSCFVVINHEES